MKEASPQLQLLPREADVLIGNLRDRRAVEALVIFVLARKGEHDLIARLRPFARTRLRERHERIENEEQRQRCQRRRRPFFNPNCEFSSGVNLHLRRSGVLGVEMKTLSVKCCGVRVETG